MDTWFRFHDSEYMELLLSKPSMTNTYSGISEFLSNIRDRCDASLTRDRNTMVLRWCIGNLLDTQRMTRCQSQKSRFLGITIHTGAFRLGVKIYMG